MDSSPSAPLDLTSDIDTCQKILHEQKSRTVLRERFLRSIKVCYDKPAEFMMHERTHVNAVFRATDIEMDNLQVSQLQTPIGIVPEALLRLSDVLSVTVQLSNEADKV